MNQIYAKKAPDPLGSYCHTIVHNNMAFCSGQIPLDPEPWKLLVIIFINF